MTKDLPSEMLYLSDVTSYMGGTKKSLLVV